MKTSVLKDSYVCGLLAIAAATLPFITGGYLCSRLIMYIACAVGVVALMSAGFRAVGCIRSADRIVENSILDKILRDSSLAYSLAVCNLITLVAGMKITAGFGVAGFLLLCAVAGNLPKKKGAE